MSTAESKKASPQTPREEILERVAENFPTWQLPRMLSLDHLNKSLASARARVNDSHKLQMAKLMEVSGHDIELENIGDEMSEIKVAGDTTYHITNPNDSGGVLSKLVPLALAAAVGAGGLYLATKKLPGVVPVPPDTNWQLDLEVKDSP